MPADVDEDALTVDDPWLTAEQLALTKANEVFRHNPDSIVIGGDTVVALGGEGAYRQLAKPINSADAEQMLGSLSGREHLVITGIAVVTADSIQVASDTTRVTFRQLGKDEVKAYVATGEPMDKAGAYAIQGGAKGFVAKVDGSLSNVIGLPVEVLRPMLETAIR